MEKATRLSRSGFFFALGILLLSGQAWAAAGEGADSNEPWWKIQGFQSEKAVRNWWSKLRASQARFEAGIPDKLKTALKKAPKQAYAIGVLEPSDRLVIGDFDCDAQPDYAVLALPKNLDLVEELARPKAKKPISLDRLQEVHFQFKKYSSEEAAQLLLLLSSKQKPEKGPNWDTFPASLIENRGVLPPNNVVGCTEVDKAAFDVDWAKSKKCEILYYSCCERDGTYLLWDSKKNELSAAGGC